MYCARLLNKSTTCSSQVTILTSSIYLLVIFFHLFSTQTCCSCPLPSCLCSPEDLILQWCIPFVLRERRREKEQVLREASCPSRCAEDKACCSMPGTAVAGTLSMACPLQGLRYRDKSHVPLRSCQLDHPYHISGGKLKPDGVVFI